MIIPIITRNVSEQQKSPMFLKKSDSCSPKKKNAFKLQRNERYPENRKNTHYSCFLFLPKRKNKHRSSGKKKQTPEKNNHRKNYRKTLKSLIDLGFEKTQNPDGNSIRNVWDFLVQKPIHAHHPSCKTCLYSLSISMVAKNRIR